MEKTLLSAEIIEYINKNTHRASLDELSTKQIAAKFNLTTRNAYSLLNEIAAERLITKLDPVNGDNFSCCGWIRNTDPENE